MKRAVIDKTRFRISRPGFDVDAASIENLLLHESFFYSQPFLFRFVACPFASFVGDGIRDESAPAISFVNPGPQLPSVALFPVDTDGITTFPARNSISSGSNQSGWPSLRYWQVTHSLTSTSITVRFRKGARSHVSPAGAYIVLFRKG
ncbi:hypothetical protein [Aliihoeflea sp. PC F10.4]